MASFQENLWDATLKWIGEQEAARTDVLSRGSVENWDKYQHEVGYIQAIRDVRDFIAEVEAKLQRG